MHAEGLRASPPIDLDRHRRRAHDDEVRWVVVVAVAMLAACSFFDEQVGISGASACVRKECRDPNAADYTRCESACRAQYQK